MIGKRQRAHRFGVAAEKYAAWLLRLKGYRIIAMRHRHPLAEIDVLALKKHMLVIVEVKARSSMTGLLESVTSHKQRRLLRAGEAIFLQPQRFPRLRQVTLESLRFDVIAVRPRRWPLHLKDAWRG